MYATPPHVIPMRFRQLRRPKLRLPKLPFPYLRLPKLPFPYLRPLPGRSRSMVVGSVMFLLGMVLGWVACDWPGTSQLEGSVVGLDARPVAATLRIEGLAGQTTTDADGHFVLPYVPGQFVLEVTAPEHLPLRKTWVLYERQKVVLEPLVLIPQPPGEGLWQLKSQGLSRVASSRIRVSDQPMLGMPSASSSSLVLEGPELVVCLEQPLLLAADGEGAPGQNPSNPAVGGVGMTFWHQVEGRLLYPLASDAVQQEGVGNGITLLRFKKPDTIAMVSPGARGGVGELVYRLEVRTCGGMTP